MRKYGDKVVTAIDVYEQQYSLSGKKHTPGSATATAIQIPLKLAFAATAHKVQGMTIAKPNCLILDFSARCQAAQGYVMLSRVQDLQQLFILGKLPAGKLFAAPQALKEVERMESVCVNNKAHHPLLSSINVRSLRLHFPDMISSPNIKVSDVICVQETWIQPGKHVTDDLQMDGFTAHFNSIGKGKGIATYFRDTFIFDVDVTQPTYQMTKVNSQFLTIINVYRTSNAAEQFTHDLHAIIDEDRPTYIIGDFNIDFISQKENRVIKMLHAMGFMQLVKHPTHILGHLLDHFYSNSCSDNVSLHQESPYFSDHDILHVTHTDKQ